LVYVALVGSLGLNIYMGSYISTMKSSGNFLVYGDANSRDTYFSIHNIAKAHEIAEGEGVKVGILDQRFAYKEYPHLYAGGYNFGGSKNDFDHVAHHGYWMALTLREVAPKAQIYALGITFENEDDKVDAIIAAIDWAIENEIDVLTYSSAAFAEQYRARVDAAVNKAVEHGIVTINQQESSRL
jgi:hypothetical protein